MDNEVEQICNEILAETAGDCIKSAEATDIPGDTASPKASEDNLSADDTSLDDIIFKTLERVKDHFLNNKMDEQKLIQFIYGMLTLDGSNKGNKTDSEVLDEMVSEVLKDDLESDCNEFLDKLFGEETTRSFFDRLTNESVDVIVEKLFGEDTKKLISEKLDSDNLDELLNKLVEEKLNMKAGGSEHPNFNYFIDKILGKDVEEFIKRKVTLLLNSDEEIDFPCEVKSEADCETK